MVETEVAERVEAFVHIAELETRATQVEAIVARLKQSFLALQVQSPTPELIESISELRWQFDQARQAVDRIAASSGIMARTPTGSSPKSPVNRNASGLRGSSRTLRIPDLIGMLSSQRKTGTLTVASGDERFVLEMLEGAVVHLVSNRPRPEQRLGTILVAKNRISAARLEAFLSEHALQGPLGVALARENLVSEEDLRDALTTQVREIFRRLFELRDAQFSFVDGKVSDLELRVCINTVHLLLDSARQHDEREARSATTTGSAPQRADDQVA